MDDQDTYICLYCGALRRLWDEPCCMGTQIELDEYQLQLDKEERKKMENYWYQELATG